MRLALRLLSRDPRIGKIFLEPHLAAKYGAGGSGQRCQPPGQSHNGETEPDDQTKAQFNPVQPGKAAIEFRKAEADAKRGQKIDGPL